MKHIIYVSSVISISIQIYAFILGYSGAAVALFLVVFWLVKFARAMYSIQARCWYIAVMIRKLLKFMTN